MKLTKQGLGAMQKNQSRSRSTLLCLLCLLSLGAAQNQMLRYALFTAGANGSFDTSGAVPAIELAEELINNDSSILPGYTLTHTGVVDTMCERTTSLNQYFDAISPPSPTILGLLGCGCSLATTPVAEIVQHNSISLVSYASASVELEDRRRFPHSFRTHPSDGAFTPASVALIKFYGWRQIMFITQGEDLFTEAFERISSRLRQSGIVVDNRMVSSDIPVSGLENEDFFSEGDDDHRIFFINTYSDIARQIICQAYQRGMFYPRYAWLTYGWYQDSWWAEEVNPDDISCTDQELAGFLDRSLALQLFPRLTNQSASTDTGLTPQLFDTLYRMRLPSPRDYTFLSTVAYDALWTFAYALNNTRAMVDDLSREEVLNMTQCEGTDSRTNTQWELVSLENFTYSNELMGCVIRWNLERTNFTGVSGQVRFGDGGSRIQSTVDLLQYRLSDGNLSQVLFASTERVNENVSMLMYEPGEDNNTVFPDGVPPDGTPVSELTTFHLSLVVIYYILAAVGIVFATVCLVFNFTQRKKKVVKLTSPNVNYFLILGGYIMYISIYFRIVPSIDETVVASRCIITNIIAIVAYCFAYGAILVKMGRIYYIFSNPTSNKKKLKDWKLILVLLLIVLIGTFMALVQVAVPVLRPTPTQIPSGEISNGRNGLGVRINYLVYACYATDNTPQTIWLGLSGAYLIVLQIIGVVLAIQTRKVKIKLLNDSKYIAVLIYISSVMVVIVFVFTVALAHVPNVAEAVASGGLIIATSLFLALIFIPKMVTLYRDPEGDNVFGNTTEGSNIEREMTFSQMKFRIEQLENTLREKESTQDTEDGGSSMRQNTIPPVKEDLPTL